MKEIITNNAPISIRKFTLISGIWIFLIGLVRYFHRPDGLDFDGAEQTYLAQWLEWGSGIQPPLPTWIFHYVFELFGHSVAWVHAVRLFFIFLIYVGFYRLSFRLLKSNQLALLSTLSLVFIFQFSSVMLKQMHTVFITLSVIYSWLCILNINQSKRLQSYLWLGFWIGIGFLSKYNFIIHIGALLMAGLSVKAYHSAILHPKILISIITAFVICGPHYVWLMYHLDAVSLGINRDLNFAPDAGTFQNISLGLTSLFIKSIAFGGILILVFIAFFYSNARRNFKREEPLFFLLIKRYMIISFFALIIVIIFKKATVFHEHWLQPFFLIFPILLFQKLKGSEAQLAKRFKIFKYLCLLIFFVISIDFSLKSYVKIYSGHPRSVFNIPYQGMANHIENYALDCEVVITRDIITAGHLKMFMPQKLIIVDSDTDHMLKESESLLESSGIVFHWNIKDTEERVPLNAIHFQNALGSDLNVEIRDIQRHSTNYVFRKNDPYKFGMASIAVSK